MADKYAYGTDEYNGHNSPSIEAGYNTLKNPLLSRVAGKYDELCLPDNVHPHTGDNSKGVLSEGEARENWEKVIKYYETHDTDGRKTKWAITIAEELDWRDT